MTRKGRSDWRRTINRYVGLVAAAAGVGIVLSSFLFLTDPYLWYWTVAAGLVVAVLGFAYGLFPFLTNQRRHHGLRNEVDAFVNLVRDLNTAALVQEGDDDFERLKSAMHDSVERMGDLAGREGRS
jgi:uncharacterized protein YjeT (DUF2065 family)